MATELEDIADLVEQLADPRTHAEPIWVYDRHRNRRMRGQHLTSVPGLVVQLQEAVQPSGAGEPGGHGYRSRPPLQTEGLSKLLVIESSASTWLAETGVKPTRKLPVLLHDVAGNAGRLRPYRRSDLVGDLRRWVRWCAVYTGWESPAYRPHVPCPACSRRSVLRVNLGNKSALCVICHAAWDETTIGVLAEHIRAVTGGVAVARQVESRGTR